MIPSLSMDFPETFKVDVKTTNNRGQTPEEVAERCVNKIIGISDNAHPAIQQQAREYKKNLQKLLQKYRLERPERRAHWARIREYILEQIEPIL